MNWKFVTVAAVLVAGIAAAAVFLYDDNAAEDAETETWDLYTERSASLTGIDGVLEYGIENLDELEPGDTVFVGRTWMDEHTDDGTADRIAALIESGVTVLAQDGNLAVFGNFIEKHPFDFEHGASVYGARIDNGTVCTASLTVPSETELKFWVDRWTDPIRSIVHRDTTTDWTMNLDSTVVRYLWYDAYMVQERQFSADSDMLDTYVLAAEKYTSVINDYEEGTDNRMKSLRYSVALRDIAGDSIEEFVPSVENHSSGTQEMTGHGKVEIFNPGISSSFSQSYRDGERFSVEYGIDDRISGNTLTAYPTYMATCDGDFSADTEMSVVIHMEDSGKNLRWTFGYITSIPDVRSD